MRLTMPSSATMSGKSFSCCPQQNENESFAQQRETEERASSILRQDPRLAHREIYCHAEAGRLILRGWVRSFFEKQLVQEALRRLDGVREIHNQVQVHPHLYEAEACCPWAEPEECPSE